jgi:single-strand DNA-binding protein
MTNRYEATGEIRAIMDTQQVTDSFRKREFALEIDDGRYSQTVKFQLVQDKTELLDDFDVGQQVRVHFNLRGREYTRKSDGATDYWTNLECWRIENAEGAGGDANQPLVSDDESNAGSLGIDTDDIPF